jgi:acyl carrier protein
MGMIMLAPMEGIRSTIIAQMEKVAAEQNQRLAPLTDDLDLLETGLDSLSFAILVSRLEDILGFDPFTESRNVYYPTVVGDFIAMYEAHKK